MDLTVTVAPALFSIDKELVKANKRVRHASENDLIDFWIAAADRYIEKRTNRSLLTQTLKLRLRRILPTVQLPRPPFQDLVSITVAPAQGTAPTIDVSTVKNRIVDMIPVIDIPGLPEADGTMEIEYKAGWSEAAKVPADLRLASLQLASHWMTSREAAFMDPRIMTVEKKIAFGVDQLVKEHRVINVNEAINGGY
jgi:uncharacterized phiE125 gp8 family phage protein